MLCHLLTKLELTASASMAQRLTDDKVFQWVNLGDRCGWVVKATALPPGRTRYPLYRRLGGPQDQSKTKENQYINKM